MSDSNDREYEEYQSNLVLLQERITALMLYVNELKRVDKENVSWSNIGHVDNLCNAILDLNWEFDI